MTDPVDPAARRRVIVIGATSQIARFLLPRLEAAGFEPVAVTRGAASAHGHSAHVMAQDGAPAFDPPLPKAAAVVTAAPLRAIASALAAAQTSGANRIVAIGSMSRFSKAGSSVASDAAFAAALSAGEDELATQARGMGATWTILRPTMVYGAGTDRNIAFIARTIRRTGLFPVPPGARGLRQPIHADDLAAAAVAALAAPEAADRAFNLGGAERLSYPDMVRRIFEALGRRPRLVPVPLAVFRAAVAAGRALPPLAFVGPEMVSRMYEDLIADNSEAARVLGHAPRGFTPDAHALGLAESRKPDGEPEAPR